MIPDAFGPSPTPFTGVALFSAVALLAGCADGDPVTPDAANAELRAAGDASAAAAQDQAQAQGVITVETLALLGQMPGEFVFDSEEEMHVYEPSEDDRPVVDGGEATLRRTENGVSVHVQMPTPQPGDYAYPAEGQEDALTPTAAPLGHPQVFTLWVFVFDPEQPAFNPEAGQEWSGAFFAAGHPVGGPNLTLSGHISKESEPVAGEMLENPDVEIHLAVAPHGGLDSDIMPEQISTPAMSPPLWWVAIFDPVE